MVTCNLKRARFAKVGSAMTPEISEFSYGFALTNEIVGWAPLTAAPLFPSLIEEGKAGGGYDVKLDRPGIAIYLQFKRAYCMVRATSREISEHNLPIALPFYRFKITESKKSDQHELLLALDEGDNLVLYAAPRFHRLNEINDAWSENRVANRSIFVRPSVIGSLDTSSHHVAYDDVNAWLCSEPTAIHFMQASEILEKMLGRLSDDKRPLRAKLPEMLDEQESAVRRAEERIAERDSRFRGLTAVTDVPIGTQRKLPTEVPLRSPRSLSGEEVLLRKLADKAARTFNSQLVIVQPNA
jgi:hypothetical protein